MKSENLHLSHAHTRAGLLATVHSLNETFTSWQARTRQRRELAQLDAWTMRDLGLSESDIQRETDKPWWQA